MPWTNDQTWALINKPQPEEIRLVDFVNKPDPEEIYHHGILGMKWGRRRFQNTDGSLTPEGKKRYYDSNGEITDESHQETQKQEERITSKQVKEYMDTLGVDYDDIYKEMGVSEDEEDNDVYKKAEYDWYNKHHKVDVSNFGNDTKSQYEYIKKNDPKMFEKIAGKDFDTDDPEIMEVVLMEYEEYKNGFR